MLLVGSQALKRTLPGLLDREPADWDLIATHDEFKAFVKLHDFEAIYPVDGGKKIICRKGGFLPVEVEIAWPGTSAEKLLDYVAELWQIGHELIPELKVKVDIASPRILCMLKSSHKYKKNSPHFQKTRKDLAAFAKYCNFQIIGKLMAIYDLRVKETYDYSHPNLKVGKTSFFTGDGVQYKYDHDSIHKAVAYPLAPAYTLYASEQEEVLSDKVKFFALPESERLRGVIEEAAVLALERSQVPYPGVLTPRQSFEFALEKVCTSITSGWFREYAYNNYDNVIELYNKLGDEWYVTKLEQGITRGTVIEYRQHAAV